MSETWDELVKKYGISGYTDSLIIANYEVFKELHEKAENWDRNAEMFNDHVQRLNEERIIVLEKLEAVKDHVGIYPDIYAGACADCPYPEKYKTREGSCKTCAVGKIKFWLEDHKKILERGV